MTPAQAAAAAQEAMAASIAKQKESIKAQAAAVSHKAMPAPGAFFAAPWVDPLPPPSPAALSAASTSVALCDPMPSMDLDQLITESAQRESVRADLIRAVIGEESAGRPCAVSVKGAQGLMQLMPTTAEQFGVTNPFDPKQNVDAGTKLLKQLLDKYGGDLAKTLSAYNAGSVRVDDADGVPAIAETENYVSDILSKLSAQ
jgi:soluble lytic murein transglycosylase-like protein